MKASTVTSKGQVTIPQEIRHRLGVEPGDRVRFREVEAGVVVERHEDRVESMFGVLKAKRGASLAEMKDAARSGWLRRGRR
jgi:AbrB family looped-hinge helix DNA binding protein